MKKKKDDISLFQQAMIFFNAENYQKALEVFQRLCRLNPNDYRIYMFLGGTYEMLDRLPEAFVNLFRAQELFELANDRKDNRNDSEKIKALLLGKNEESLAISPRILFGALLG